MVAPVISSLPTAPQRTDLPATFSERADAFVAALQPFRNQLNAALEWQNLTFQATQQALNQANQARDAAQDSAANAEQSNQESQAAKDLSQQWAESDDPVEGGRSSKYWSEQAEVVAAAVQSAAGLPSLAGNARAVLTVLADESGVAWGQPAVPPELSFIEFSESGNFEKHPLAQFIYVEVVPGGPGGEAGDCRITASGSNTIGPVGSRPSGPSVSRLFRSSEVPSSSAVYVGQGGQGGQGGEYEAFYDAGDETVITNTAKTTYTLGENSYFIGSEVLSSAMLRLPAKVEMEDEVLRGYPSLAGDSARVFVATDNGSSSVQAEAGNGRVDDSTKLPAQSGENALGVLPPTGETLTLTASDGGPALEYCGGAPGGCAAIGNNRASAGVYLQNVTATAIAGKGSDGGTGSPGGPGGSAIIGRNPGNGTTLRVVAGNGGNGGNGIVRIWQW